MIKRIRVENFKSLKDVTVELTPFTVLIGSNNSGKTNFLQALEFLSATTHEPIHDAATRVGSRYEDLFFNHQPDSLIKFSVDLVIALGDMQVAGRYEIALHSSGRIVNEALSRQEGADWAPMLARLPSDEMGSELVNDDGASIGISFSSGALSGLMEVQHRLDCTHVSLFRQSLNTGFFDLDPSAMRSPAPPSQQSGLESRGENLAAVLDWLLSQHRSTFSALEQSLRAVIPSVKEIQLPVTAEGKKSLTIVEDHGNGSIPASAISDGILRYLGMLILAYNPDPPPLICVEEPENGIHPRRLEKLVELLRWATTRTDIPSPPQIIVTTHSPLFLDWFANEPECVWVLERKEGATISKRASEVPHLRELLEDFSLGEAWYRGDLGGVP